MSRKLFRQLKYLNSLSILNRRIIARNTLSYPNGYIAYIIDHTCVSALLEASTTSILFETWQIEKARKIDYYCRRIFPVIFIILIILPLLLY